MTLRTDVAVLYVDPRGPYPKLVADWYDEKRDARTYAGPLPVVCHPPCAPWSKLKHLFCSLGDKGDAVSELGQRAIMQVRRFGGILEHPAHSVLFRAMALPRPYGHDRYGYTIPVNQCDFGHVARKPTWLYVVGVPYDAIALPPPGEPTHWCSGGRTSRPGMGATVPPGIKVCSAQQRRRTPIAFAEWLLDLAAQAGKVRAA